MSSKTVISIANLSKQFGDLTAVNNVSLDLAEGEFFALLGPSGCGKTSLLRMIAGFEEPSQGTIRLDGKDLHGIGADKRPINLMFQSYALFPHLTVRGNVAYGLEMEKLDKREIATRVDDILEMTQLTAWASRKPDQLSGGQRQRVALSRALIKRPRVLLLDEPLGALDKKLREQMQLELKRLQHELGITFVVVTHDQEEALVMANRIALMKDGQIVQLGDPKSLYEKPVSRFVAQFIGETNLFEGTATNNGIQVEGLGELIVSESTTPGNSAALSVRPERIMLSHESRNGDWNSLQGKVTDAAYRGQDISLMVTLEHQETPITIKLPASEGSSSIYSNGKRVWCNWRPEHSRLLTQ